MRQDSRFPLEHGFLADNGRMVSFQPAENTADALVEQWRAFMEITYSAAEDRGFL